VQKGDDVSLKVVPEMAGLSSLPKAETGSRF
jgi:hypothetical protein